MTQTGLRVIPSYLDLRGQALLLGEVRRLISAAPLFTPRMPRTGRPFAVRMTNCGQLGWVSDDGGYRYQTLHPTTRAPWPTMPESLLRIWSELGSYPHPPEACLVNVYDASGKLGMHQDRDEEDLAAPVISLSLGDACMFRVGGTKRGDPSNSIRLASGDVVVLAGDARLAFHGVDRILPGTSPLLFDGGRINLTMRRVTKP